MIKQFQSKNTYVVFFMDMALVAVSMILSFLIRFEFHIPPTYVNALYYTLILAILTKMTTFVLFKIYEGRWRFLSIHALMRIVKAIIVSSALTIFAALLAHPFLTYSRSIFLIDFVLTLLLIWGIRVGIRLYYLKNSGQQIFPFLGKLRPEWKKLLFVEASGFFVDALLVLLSLYLAYQVRFDFRIPAQYWSSMLHIMPLVLVIKMSTFVFFRMYQGIWRFLGFVEMLNVVKAAITSTMSVMLMILVIYRFEDYPRSVFIIDGALTLILIGAIRLLIRVYFTKSYGIDALTHMKPATRKILIVEVGSFLIDAVLVAFSFYLAYLIRFEFAIPAQQFQAMMSLLPLVFMVKMGAFIFFHLYQQRWRATNMVDVFTVCKAIAVSSFGLILFVLAMSRFQGYSRSIFIIDAGLILLMMCGVRGFVRFYLPVNQTLSDMMPETEPEGKESNGKKLLIIGAGIAGENVLREIQDNPTLKLSPVGFLDDSREKQDRMIHGVKVLGTIDQIEQFRHLFEEILIAIPSASGENMRRIVAACERTGKRFQTIPGIAELIDGKISVKAVRSVTMQDLLGREEIRLDREEISAYLHEKRVLITGAGGSIGSELVRQVCRFNPTAVGLVEMSEFNLFRMETECHQQFGHIRASTFLMDIRDQGSVNRIFKAFRPHVVFHTAAYKHVPMQEIHPWEAVRNNIYGTRNLITAAQKYSVERFVLVSTDKAVRPTNVMGATKRVAEKLVISASKQTPDIQFMIVRFGNVMGSSGSVIPMFQDQISRGGPVTVTHPEVTRYFMSIPEAAQLILEAGSLGKGGEIFLLQMGKPIKVVDLARDLIRLHGYQPDRDIMIQFVGLRPGEKLCEELITQGEGIVKTDHEKIMVLRGENYDLTNLQAQVNELLLMNNKVIINKNDTEVTAENIAEIMAAIKYKLQEIVPEYVPEFRRAKDREVPAELLKSLKNPEGLISLPQPA